MAWRSWYLAALLLPALAGCAPAGAVRATLLQEGRKQWVEAIEGAAPARPTPLPLALELPASEDRPLSESRHSAPTLSPTVPATAQPSAAPQQPTPPGPAYAFVAEFRGRCSVILGQVPAYGQQHNLSCEAAATRMVLAGRGQSVAEEEILGRMGHDPNPHLGFRGNVDGYGLYPDLRDYGTYAEVVARVLASYDAPAQVTYGLSDDQLRQAVQAGKAVIVWVTPLDNPLIIEQPGYQLVEGEHVLVVVGLGKDGSFLVHDPWGARPDSGRAGTYLVPAIQGWDLFERMAVLAPLQ